MEFLQSS